MVWWITKEYGFGIEVLQRLHWVSIIEFAHLPIFDAPSKRLRSETDMYFYEEK